MNQNGTVVLSAIEDLEEPVTAKNIVDYLALKAEVNPDKELRDTVKTTLDGGVRFGFLQKKGARYFIPPKDDDSDDDEASPGRRRNHSHNQD